MIPTNLLKKVGVQTSSSTTTSTSSLASSHSSSNNNSPHLPNYKKWPLHINNILQDELARLLFHEYLKEINNENMYFLYFLLQCIPQCVSEEQRIEICKMTYNKCIRNNEQSLSELSEVIRERLAICLEKHLCDNELFDEAKKELIEYLEKKFFCKFLQSKFYISTIKIFEGQSQAALSVLEGFLKCQNVDEQLKVLLEGINGVGGSATKRNAFIIPTIPPNHKNLKSLTQQQQPSIQQQSSSQILKTTTVNETTPNVQKIKAKSRVKLNESTTSRISSKSLNFSTSKKSTTMPPNPYHIEGTVIPVSAQDSELQSLSSDALTEDNFSYKMNSSSSRHNNRNNGHTNRNRDDATDSSTTTSTNQSSNVQKLNETRKLHKQYRQMKQSAEINKNVDLDMPFKQIPRTELLVKSKELPLCESDPKKFAELLCSKLEEYLHQVQGEHHHADEADDDTGVMRDSKLKKRFDLLSLQPLTAVNPKEGIIVHIDEHFDRVFSETGEKHPTAIKSNHRSHLNTSNNNHSVHSGSSSFITCLPQHNNTLNNTSQLLSTSINARMFGHKHGGGNHSLSQSHLFYQHTSTSKEVDIDENNEKKRLNKTLTSQMTKKVNQSDNNYDSGCSIRSASTERVNDWLAQSNATIASVQPPQHQPIALAPVPQQQMQIKPILQQQVSVNKTTVAYYLPGEDLAYVTNFNGDELTLAQFKQLITKKGRYRFFFKTISDLLGEDSIVYQEINDDQSYVPKYNNKVIAKIEKSNEI